MELSIIDIALLWPLSYLIYILFMRWSENAAHLVNRDLLTAVVVLIGPVVVPVTLCVMLIITLIEVETRN